MNSSKPNSSKPSSSKPNSSKPSSSKPNSSKPNSSKPNSSKPNSSKPNSSKPNSSKPNSSKPNSPKPNLQSPTRPSPTLPNSTIPNPSAPNSTIPNPSVPNPVGEMLPEIDLFSNPEILGDVKRTVELLRDQIKIFEALKHAKDRLQKVQALESNTLSKCKVFIGYVNQADPQSNFFSEVSQLDLNGLVFSSISFEDRRLKTLLDSFKASYIQTYVEKEEISCLGRTEISTRINHVLAGCKGSQFDNIYNAQIRLNSDLAKRDVRVTEETFSIVLDPQPQTAAEGPDAYKFLGAPWEKVKNMFGEEIANVVSNLEEQSSLEMMYSVRSRYPQFKSGGDALVCLDIGADADLMFRLFRNDKGDTSGARVAAITQVFGSRIANAIEESDLRKWEIRNGHVDGTSCVKMACQVQLRICYDTDIANDLYSHNQVVPPEYSD